ncbi:FHA domain-containing protein [Chamaesiphon sp. VAR_48_metabat_403]|uniref:FHA domain-containing protein n=1 Tax=Chamaesiphon sp. VAR_48_metabat_403 TaxID=2964700 RepID=UPI00286D9E66|nr:FHA domain-containing protein [Chamaesiphon sp. VAR_48_metabat_403]
MQIRLMWEDPATGERKEPLLTVPIALGREFARLPETLGTERVSRIVLNSLEVSRYHASIEVLQDKLIIVDRGSSNGIIVNGSKQPQHEIAPGDVIQLGNYQISISIPTNSQPLTTPASQSQIGFNAVTNRPDPRITPPPVVRVNSCLPPIFQQSQIDPQTIHATGLPVEEVEYATIGGGLGSFIWVDLLRVGGVSLDRIRVLGMEQQPYGRYQQLCLNTQIVPQERLRSPADACPDNLWGFPNYATLEAVKDIAKGKLRSGLSHLWQVFAEPTLASTYTPKSGDVIAAIDREAARISWRKMTRTAHVEAIRKTTDGRYAIVYTCQQPTDYACTIARYVHIATGYPALQFLPDLQAYRDRTQDFKTVVNAYEPHEHIYESLANYGGTVLLRGTGIVAARILQKLYTLRRNNDRVEIRVIQLLRSAKIEGNKYGLADRKVEHNYEFQPFNWPKSAWGGQYKTILENSTPEQRQNLLADWGGVTTINRPDWRKIITGGINKGWYQIFYGEVQQVVPHSTHGGTITTVKESGIKGDIQLESDFIIDATAVDAPIMASPLLQDLVQQYNLPLNQLGRLTVNPEFELTEMANQTGKIYASGSITLGNYYAPVDSFLGLQYAAFNITQDLLDRKAIELKPLVLSRSLVQWWKWMNNRSPN